MKLRRLPQAIAACLLASGSAHAVELTVSITNLTQGMLFTPRLLVAHTGDVDIFQPGTAASEGLTAIAEGGDTSVLATALDADSADVQANQTFGGPLAAATSSADYQFETNDHPFLSLVTMLIPTNDAFAGLDSWRIPTEPGTYTVTLNAYDAGTEANDEINSAMSTLTGPGGIALGGAPGSPGMAAPPPTQDNLGTGGTGVAVEAVGGVIDGEGEGEGNVHIHRNVLGDTDPNGGRSDLDSTVHRWLNPVARMTITVN